jgi:hypothetical protein
MSCWYTLLQSYKTEEGFPSAKLLPNSARGQCHANIHTHNVHCRGIREVTFPHFILVLTAIYIWTHV